MNIETKIENPVRIRLSDTENVVLADEVNKQNNSLVPGVMFGGSHYGFLLITDMNEKQKEMVYPTQCRIDAVGIEGGILKVFEEGKYHPWLFTYNGEFKQEASYNPYSRKDKAFAKDEYGLNMRDAVYRFTLKIKK